MNSVMLSCKKATELIEKRQVGKLALMERLQLSMHTSMCDACSAYEKQSVMINRAIGRWFQGKTVAGNSLSQEARERIIKEMENL